MTRERLVTCCDDCPFAEKEGWNNDEGDSGTDYTGCALGLPADRPHHESIREIAAFAAPPTWCKLREGLVQVRLK